MSPRFTKYFFWSISLLSATAYIWRNMAAGFAFPVPWPDESSFLWQAISIQRVGALFASELNPLREVMWMPPGYMIFIGGLFKIFGASFVLARGVSLVCMIGSFLLLAAIVKKYQYPIASVALLSAAFLTAPVVVMGNIARMEAVLLLVVSLSMFLFERRLHYLALALITLSPLIHPNGVYFCVAAVGYFFHCRRKEKIVFGKTAMLLLAFSIAVWALYIAHIGGHWNDFLSDMTMQFYRKGGENTVFLHFIGMVVLFPFCAMLVYGYFVKITSPLRTWFGMAMLFVYGVGVGVWYAGFYMIAIALLIGITLPMLMALMRSLLSKWQIVPQIKNAIIALVVIPVYGGFLSLGLNGSLLNVQGGWLGMRMEENGVPYVTDGDIAAVEKYIATLQSTQKPLIVQCIPEADALFYTDMETDRLHFCQGTFYAFDPDVYIVHTSRYITARLQQRIQSQIGDIGVFHGDTANIILSRDSTEIYYYLFRPKR